MAALSARKCTESSLARLQQAFELVRERPPSRSKAFVLTQLAFRAASVLTQAGSNTRKKRSRWLRVSERKTFGHTVLTSIGTALGTLVSRGIESLEQAVEIADAIDSMEGVRARVNLAARFQSSGELQRCFEVHARARSHARRFGLRDCSAISARSSFWSRTGAGAGTRAPRRRTLFSTKSTPVIPTRSGRCSAGPCGRKSASRGVTLANAIVDGEKAVDVARDWTVWGFLVFPLAGLARTMLAAGRLEEADALVTEAVGMGLRETTYAAPDLATALVELGRRDELASAIEAWRPSLWHDAAQAFVAGDYIGAAERYAEIGSVPHEAEARLRTGRADQVRRALDFYRSVGATRYIREGEALLAATA